MKRFLLIVVLLLAVLSFVAMPFVDAFALIARVAVLPGTAATVADWRAQAIVVDPIQKIPTRYGPVDGRIYRPASGQSRRAATLVPGVHMDGIRETRLVGLAEDLAASGFTILTVATPDLQRFQITPRSTDIFEDAALWLADQQPNGEKIGMFGISFSGGLSIVAAGRPKLRDRVAFVMALGGHGNLPRVMRYLCSGNAPAMPALGDAADEVAGIEHLTIRPPHDYGVAVVLMTFADRGLVPADQVEPLRTGVMNFLLASSLTLVDKAKAEAEFKNARDYAATLPEPSKTLMTYVNDRAVDKLGPVLMPILDAIKVEEAADPSLSPDRSPAPAAAVYLMHGAEDNVIPSVETVLLTGYLQGKTDVHAVLSAMVTHAEVDKSAAAKEAFRLVTFWRRLMNE